MESEQTQSRKRLKAERILGGLALLYLGLLLFVQLSQHVVRRRAEQLLMDFRTVRAGVATWSDVQRLQSRWRPWEEAYGNQSCCASSCDLQIQVFDWMLEPASKLPSSDQECLRRALTFLFYDHFPLARLDVSVRNGIVHRSSFSIETWVPRGYGPPWKGQGPEPAGYVTYRSGDYGLHVHATSVPTLLEIEIQNAGNRDYLMQPPDGCEDCMGFFTEFAKTAKDEDIAWLTAFDFSCMTGLHTCTEVGDLMPVAWRRYKQSHPEVRHENALD